MAVLTALLLAACGGGHHDGSPGTGTGRASDDLAYARFRHQPAGSPRLVVLTYHDVDPQRQSPYSLDPGDFEAQMQMLVAAGFHTISVADLLAWIGGGALPPHPVLLTFDDGIAGVARFAEPVLARLHLHAVAFVITGFPGTHGHYYMGWPDLHALFATGRWDLESHSQRGHTKMAVDGTGAEGPFFTNRAWLPAENRQETLAEYQERVSRDLSGSKSDLVAQGFPSPSLFAFPYSADRDPTDDPAIPQLLAGLVDDQFRVAMLDSSSFRPVTETERLTRRLTRFDVLRGLSASTVFDVISRPDRPWRFPGPGGG